MIYVRLVQGSPTRTRTRIWMNWVAEEGSSARRASRALANTTASTLRIARSGGACEIPGRAHTHDSGGKLNYCGGGTTMSGVPCLGTGAANHEGELSVILLPKALAGSDEFAWAAAGDARHTWMAMAECVSIQLRRSSKWIRWYTRLTAKDQITDTTRTRRTL